MEHSILDSSTRIMMSTDPADSPQRKLTTMENVKWYMRGLLKKLPLIGRAYVQRDDLRAVVNQLWQPPGHFYSPLPSKAEIRDREAAIFDATSPTVEGVDLNETVQLQMFAALAQFYHEQPFPRTKQEGLRYFFENNAYSYFDGIIFYSMLRHLKPRHVIEIGCGYSSCLLLDTNERFFRNSIACTFIEPYPQLLLSLMKEPDRSRVTVIPTKLQDVDPDVFTCLEPNDVLFVDSSHVSKTGSDVNHVFFDILPRLAPGVYIHFHDIFHPFEYPKAWVYQGRAWNEAYLLRAFLQYNDAYAIQISNSFLELFHRDVVNRDMPLCLNYSKQSMIPTSAQSIWLRKIRG
jgi:methyltransferase family protein